MIKTFIVDDDIAMLKGLRQIIPWEKYGFEIVGQGVNGEDALTQIKVIKPDLLITDISMPVMDGLELIRKSKAILPELKTIILTCHEDFNYAKEAVQLEADDYVIKLTLTAEELLLILNRIKEKHLSYKEKENKRLQMNQEFHKNRHGLIRTFFSDIISYPRLNRGDLTQKAAALGLRLPEKYYRVIGIFIDNFELDLMNCPVNDENLVHFALINILEECLAAYENKTFFIYRSDTIILLLWDNTQEAYVSKSIKDKLSLFQVKSKDYLKLSISHCIGNTYNQLSELGEGINDTLMMRDLYFYGNSSTFKPLPDNVAQALRHKLKEALSTHNHEVIITEAEHILELFDVRKYNPKDTKLFFQALMKDIEVYALTNDISLNLVYPVADLFDTYKKILMDIFDEYFKRLNDRVQSVSRQEIQDVLTYIESNLEKAVTLESMADYIGMNSSYFSRLFKQETGSSFSDYLNHLRIKRADQLLVQTDMSLENIAQAVGMGSASYFCRAYKKATGQTPGKTRELKTIL